MVCIKKTRKNVSCSVFRSIGKKELHKTVVHAVNSSLVEINQKQMRKSMKAQRCEFQIFGILHASCRLYRYVSHFTLTVSKSTREKISVTLELLQHATEIEDALFVDVDSSDDTLCEDEDGEITQEDDSLGEIQSSSFRCIFVVEFLISNFARATSTCRLNSFSAFHHCHF